jgi:hypothetical protein
MLLFIGEEEFFIKEEVVHIEKLVILDLVVVGS